MSRRLGAVEAIIVDTIKRGPGQMGSLGRMGRMGDLGDTLSDPNTTSLLDAFTGGQYTIVSDKLDTISIGLKISIFASVLSGALAAVSLFGLAGRGAVRNNPARRRRRRRRFF